MYSAAGLGVSERPWDSAQQLRHKTSALIDPRAVGGVLKPDDLFSGRAQERETVLHEGGGRVEVVPPEYPLEYAEIILSVLTFLLDPGVFLWTGEEREKRMRGVLADLLEKGLGTEPGSFAFPYGRQAF